MRQGLPDVRAPMHRVPNGPGPAPCSVPQVLAGAALHRALHAVQDELPTYRGQNEQSMAHAAIAYAKANFRRRFMACTSSIGPGALNMVTAAALAHVNRIPVLLLPGDVFANRLPDPVLQQVEDFGDGTVSANDCFKPVSR